MLRIRSRALGTTRFAGVMTGAITLLGTESQGLAIDFTDMSMRIRDTGTPENSFKGNPNDKLTYTTPSAKYVLGRDGLLTSGTTLRTSFDASGNALGLLVEEGRTNACLRSNDFDNATWGKTGAAVTANQTAAPDGATTADLLVASAGNTTHFTSQTVSPSAGATTWSFYAKYSNRQWILLRGFDGTTLFFGSFDIQNGVVGSIGGAATTTMTAVGNGWYRCTMTATTASGTGSILIALQNADAVSITTWNAAGTESVYVWGAQMEAGAFATSLIVTAGSTVARSADVITIATSAYPHSATVNSAMVKYRPVNVATAMVALRWDDGTSNEVVSVGHSAAAAIGLTVTDGGAGQTAPLTSGTATADTAEKIAVSWKADDFLLSDNGAAAVADTSGTLPTVTSLDIGPTLTGYVQQILVVPVEKSAAEVAAMAA